jgi:hypothetical protein
MSSWRGRSRRARSRPQRSRWKWKRIPAPATPASQQPRRMLRPSRRREWLRRPRLSCTGIRRFRSARDQLRFRHSFTLNLRLRPKSMSRPAIPGVPGEPRRGNGNGNANCAPLSAAPISPRAATPTSNSPASKLRGAGEQSQQLHFIDDRNLQLQGLVQLRSRLFAGHHITGLLAHRSSRLSSVVFDSLLRFIAA